MKRRILIAVDDIFFASKIRAAAESAGIEYDSARTVVAAIEKAHAHLPALVIADLHSERCDALALAEALRADPQLKAVPLVGFFSHVQTELRDRALAAGFDRALPRSVFSHQLAKMMEDLIA